MDSKAKFQGSSESFVFKVQPGDFEYFPATSLNKYYMYCEYKSLTIGSEGDGPAIRLDEKLTNGRTCASETFGNPILIHQGKKHVDD